MSDYSLFHVIAADETDKRKIARQALVLSETRINERLGKFLGNSKTASEFDNRLSLVADDFKGIIETTCLELGHDNPQAIAKSLYAHYRPQEQQRTASVHEARRPKMCPYHNEVVDISLATGDPRAGYESMSSHAWGNNHCQGKDFEGKCNFKKEMVTQSFWDDHQKNLDERREQRQQDAQRFENVTPINEVPVDETPVAADEPSIMDGADSAVGTGTMDGGTVESEPLAIAASTHEADKDWIQKAVKRPGQLHKDLGVPEGEKIPEEKLEEAEKSDDPKEKERAQFAENMKGLKKGSVDSDSGVGPKASKNVPCPECGGDGKTAGNTSCPRCHGQGRVSDWGESALDALESSVDKPTISDREVRTCPNCGAMTEKSPCTVCGKPFEKSARTADKGNTDLGGPEPKIDKRKWNPKENAPELPDSKRHPTKQKDITEPIKRKNNDGITNTEPLEEIGEGQTESVKLPAAEGDDSGFAPNNMEKGPHTKTWKGTDGQADPVTSKADDVNKNPIRELIVGYNEGFIPQSTIEAAVKKADYENMRTEWLPEQVTPHMDMNQRPNSELLQKAQQFADAHGIPLHQALMFLRNQQQPQAEPVAPVAEPVAAPVQPELTPAPVSAY